MPSARTDLNPGEVWFVELRLVEKSRPVLVLAAPSENDARALVIVAPLTSQLRSMRGEVHLGKPRWLSKESAVNLQGLASLDPTKLVRRMGILSPERMNAVKASLRDLLGL
ncbi:MAG TPA: type II toxin-antitoxin system PemK/MazF family toxin [Verrucomicrobiae bacterium]|jgi:mRNA-degrading endonuclease toxin of MazEF toxin-antitoxin module|nr:type II toxin-antitoxin system PemK/MazF family toxin [Verrucomicrobiae bacterium]